MAMTYIDHVRVDVSCRLAPLWQQTREPNSDYRSGKEHGVVILGRDIVDIAAGTVLWQLPQNPPGVARPPDGPASDHHIVDGTLVSLVHEGQGLYSATGYAPRSGERLWRTDRTRLPFSLWHEYLHDLPFAPQVNGEGPCLGWAMVDPVQDRILWQADAGIRPRDGAATGSPVLLAADTWFLPHEVTGLDTRTGTARWRVDDPAWSLMAVGETELVFMRLWDPLPREPVLCHAHAVDFFDEVPADPVGIHACEACNAALSLRVVDRATGEPLWSHDWRCAPEDSNIAWTWAVDFVEGQRLGAAAICGHTLITGEGRHLLGRSLRDGTLRWAVPAPHAPGSSSLVFDCSCSPSNSIWMPFTFDDMPGTFLIHGATGDLAYSRRPVRDLVGDIALVHGDNTFQALRLERVERVER